jgi:DNA polymerase alpha-associated DNA helicase A
MTKEKPVKVTGGSTGADVEVNVEELDIKDKTRLKPPRTLETTLFDRLEKLYGDGIKRVLKIQYRQVGSRGN